MGFMALQRRGAGSESQTTNEVLGVYVPAGERLSLYLFLDKVQGNALYCDPDSIIYVQK
jgi:hypothetical protein